jgi:polyisoprenyl-phosphate glycosyltransferase
VLVSIVTPVLNEESAVARFAIEIEKAFENIDHDYEIVFVDDGSSDETFSTAVQLKKNNAAIRIVKLSRNFGKEAALTAGIDYAKGDAVIPMDVDLQDPPELLPQMIETFESGFDVVLARRVDRGADSLFKRSTSGLFYKLIGKLSNTDIPDNVGDFRMISRKVVNSLKRMNETQRFMKGILSWPGYSTTYVEYSRPVRSTGDTKFNGRKLLGLAIDGITSFSYIPLRMWTFIGALISGAAFVYASFMVVRTLLYGIDVAGYASLLVAILFLGGVQLMGLGFLGEYIGRIYIEVKQRPIYLVDEEL